MPIDWDEYWTRERERLATYGIKASKVCDLPAREGACVGLSSKNGSLIAQMASGARAVVALDERRVRTVLKAVK